MKKYFKVGSNNPKVSLVMEDLTDTYSNNLPIDTPISKVGADHILGTVFWISDTKAGAIWLNRRQNYGVIVSYTYVSTDEWKIDTVSVSVLLNFK